jgi:hypothetical protein
VSLHQKFSLLEIYYMFSAAGGILCRAPRIAALLMGTDAPPGVFKKSAANYIPAAISSFYIVVFWACLIFIFSHSGARLCAARRGRCVICKKRLEGRIRIITQNVDAAPRSAHLIFSLCAMWKRAAAFSHAYEHNRAEIDSICGSEHRS